MAGELGGISGTVRLDIRQAVAAYAALRAQNAKTVYALRGTGDSFVQAGQTMAYAGAGMVYVFGKAVQAAAEFERKMDYFGAVSDTNAAKMKKLETYTLDLAEATIYSADEIAEGFIELAKAGVSAEQIMTGIGDAMANLGAAGDIPLAQSGQIITSTIQQFDLAARDAVKVTDLLAGAANASIADISDIGVSLKYVGGVANAVGLTFEDTTTAISLLAKAGIRGSTAGTSLRQMLVSLGGATEPARDSLKELGILSGDELTNAFFTANGEAKSLSKVFQILNDATADLTAKERLMHLRTIFNNRALAAASILTREGAKGFREMNREMSKTTAADVASERLDNLSGDIEILKGNLQTLLIEQGGPFQEMLRGWVQNLTKLIQAFDELDPATQKNIVGFIGLAGVSLLLMGMFSIIVGTVFRFVAAMLKLGAGIAFVFKHIKNLWVWARLLASVFAGPVVAAIGAITLPVWLAIAAVVALVAVFVLLYKKSETFRNGIAAIGSAIGGAISDIVGFFKLLATDPSAAWDKLKSKASELVSAVVAAFQALPGKIWGALQAAGAAIGNFVGNAITWFGQMGSRVISTVSSFVSQLLSYFTLRNVGYALGFALGLVVRLFIAMGRRIIPIVAAAVTGVIGWFQKLPGRIAAFLTSMANRGIALMVRLALGLARMANQAYNRVVSFFSKLPGRVLAFITRTVVGGIAAFLGFVTRLPEMAANTVTGILNWISKLPGRVASFLTNVVNRARSLLSRLPEMAIEMGYNMYNGLMNAITGLPAAVSGLLGRIIDAIKGQITAAFNAVRDFGAGMWEGFKDGIGISSPSYIEEAMFALNKNVSAETKDLAKKTLEVQRLSKKMAATKFGWEDTHASSGYARLASDRNANRNRSRTLMTASMTRPDRASHPQSQGSHRERFVSGELDISPNGRAFIRGTAQEVFDGSSDYEDSTNRMDY